MLEVEKLYMNPVFQVWIKDMQGRHQRALRQGSSEAFNQAMGIERFFLTLEGIVNEISTNVKKAREEQNAKTRS